MKYRGMLLYDDTAPWPTWLKILLLGISLLLASQALYLMAVDIGAVWLILGMFIFLILLFYSIFPGRYQVYEDRISIVLGKPFVINIPFSNIREKSPVFGSKSFICGGIRLATSSKNVLEIILLRGSGIVISPYHRQTFLEEF